TRTGRDRGLREIGYAIHRVAQPNAMPILGRGLRQPVFDYGSKWLALRQAQDWSGNGPAVSPHRGRGMSGTKQECAGSAGIKLTAREVEDAPATEAIGGHSRFNTAAPPARRDCLRASLRIGLLGIDHVLRGRDPGGR